MEELKQERLEREKEFHNNVFVSGARAVTDKYYKSATESKEFYHQKILEKVSNKTVLEYGCGPGSLAFTLAEQGAKVYGIDISDVAINLGIKEADERGLAINFSVMNAESLDFDDNTFDVICGTGILHHLDLEKAYSELKRVLKPGAKAIFFEPLGHNIFINVYRDMTPSMRTEDEHPLLMKDIEYANAFFKKTEVNYFNLTSTLSSFIPTLNNVLTKVDKAIFTWMPFLRKYSWIVVIEFSDPK